MALHFAPRLHVAPSFMEVGLSVSTPVGDSLDTDVVDRGCLIKIEGGELPTNLVLLDMEDFDVILGMD